MQSVAGRLNHDRLRIENRGGGYQAVNPFRGLQGNISPDGMEVRSYETSKSGRKKTSPVEQSWKLKIGLGGVGRAGPVSGALAGKLIRPDCGASDPKGLSGECNGRIEIQRPGVREYFRNLADGLEHGFYVDDKPAGDGGLKVTVMFNGMQARAEQGGQTVVFTDGKRDVLQYTELKVFDGAGRKLDARMSVETLPTGVNAKGDLTPARSAVVIAVNDRDARYPIHIDPVITPPSWLYESNIAAAELGYHNHAIGDVNGDGFGDLAVSMPDASPPKVLVFHGNPNGFDPTPTQTITGPAQYGTYVAGIGDFNNDGVGDMVVGSLFLNSNGGQVDLFLGSNPGGVAPTPTRTVTGTGSDNLGWVVEGIGDSNGDGFADFIAGSPGFDVNKGKVTVFYGNTGSLLTNTATILGSSLSFVSGDRFGESVAWTGDYNRDGLSDFIAGSPSVGKYFNIKGVATPPPTAYATPLIVPASPSGEVFVRQVGDLDGDKRTDIIFSSPDWNAGNTEIRIWLAGADNNGYGGPPARVVSPPYPGAFNQLDVGDVDGDGWPDVVVSDDFYNNANGVVNVYRMRSNPPFASPLFLDDSSGARQEILGSGQHRFGHRPAVGDFNGDGFADVVVGSPNFTGGQTLEGRVSLFFGRPLGTPLQPTGQYEPNVNNTTMGKNAFRVGDINGDGYDDALFTNPNANTGYAWLFYGGGAGLGSPVWQASAPSGFAYGVSAAGGDFNGDGYSDVAISQVDIGNNAFNVHVYISTGASGLPATPNDTLSGPAVSHFGASIASIGDINRDGFGDLLIGQPNPSGNGKALLFTGSPGVNPLVFSGWEVMGDAEVNLGMAVGYLGDINGDGYGDIAVGSRQTGGTVTIYEGRNDVGTGQLPSTVPAATINSSFGLAGSKVTITGVGDTDGDGFNDFIITASGYNSNDGVVRWYKGGAAIDTTDDWSFGGAGNQMGHSAAPIGDINGDGFNDFAFGTPFYSSNDGLVYVMYGSPSGPSNQTLLTYTGPTPPTEFGSGIAGVGDANGDGFSDFVVGAPTYTNGNNYEGAVTIYHGGGKGRAWRFTQMKNIGVPMPPGSINQLTSGFNLRFPGFNAIDGGYWTPGARLVMSPFIPVGVDANGGANNVPLSLPQSFSTFPLFEASPFPSIYWRAQVIHPLHLDPRASKSRYYYDPGNLAGTGDYAFVMGRTQGNACVTGAQCNNGFCVDGFCCESACNQPCLACANALTGGANGTCAPAYDNTDPHNDCASSPPTSCGDDGMCNGSGQCRKYGPATQCANPFCSGVNNEFANSTAFCDGAGDCGNPSQTDCTPFRCGGGGSCLTACSTLADCTPGNYCNGSNQCVAQQADGASCTIGTECASGNCVDGVCCNTICTGSCQACSAAKTGGTDGVCADILTNTDPDSECPMCSVCNGGGSCAAAAPGLDPKNECFGSGVCGSCNGSGSCYAPVGESCNGLDDDCDEQVDNNITPAMCSGYSCEAGSCRTTCSMPSHCAPPYFCDGGVCVPPRPNGQACIVNSECSSSFCGNGVCASGFICSTDEQCAGPYVIQNQSPALYPANAVYAAMAYAPSTGKAYYFGGDNDGPTNDTYEYNPVTNQWTLLNPSVKPTARFGHAMTYMDSCNAGIYMYGGTDGSSNLNDIWKFDPVAGEWSLQVANAGGVAVAHAKMAKFDSCYLMILGGETMVPADSAQIIKYNVLDQSITFDIFPGTQRREHAMVYSPAFNAVLLFGGREGTNYLDDTWRYDAGTATWTNLNPGGRPPPTGAAVYWWNESRNRFDVYGGLAIGDSLTSDIHSYDPLGNQWQTHGGVSNAVALRNMSAAYIGAPHNRAVVSGGNGEEGPIDQTQTVLWTINEYCKDGDARCFWRKPLAAACSADPQCLSNHCADGVCCNAACDNTCEACVNAITGQPDGQCQAVPDGQDPDSECTDQGPSACSTDGSCNGSRNCRIYAAGTECTQNYCVDSDTFQPAYTCQPGEVFSCQSVPVEECGPYICEGSPGAAGCRTICTVDAHCVSTHYCNGGSCDPKQSNGAVCASGAECTSGNCVDGFCCDLACNGLCEACSAVKTGAPNGQCAAVPTGQDPDSECADDGAASCLRDGFCNGGGACRLYANGVECVQNSCTGAQNETLVNADTCNGSGTCMDNSTTSCAPFKCTGAPGSASCASTCVLDSDCVSSHYCDGANICQPKKAQGVACSLGNECQSNSCADGFCCDSPCNGFCEACSMAKSGAPNGQCAAVPSGQDPDSECVDQGAASCANDGYCDGAGSCRMYANGTICQQNSCTGAENETLVNTDQCNGSGTCVDNNTTSCAPYKCTGAPGSAACANSCVDDSDCVSGYYCDGANTCQPKKAQGVVCSLGNECQSSFCTDGVCCDSACGGLCKACVLAKTGSPDGQCAPVLTGSDPDAECTDDGASSCQRDGMCNGAGACRLYANGVVCQQNSCTGVENETLVNADQCNGLGTCVDNSTTSCAPYKCTGAPGSASCANTCVSDTDCVSTHYCDGANTCQPKKAQGVACAAANQCQSNFCTDGVCCDSACGGLCKACSYAKNGVADGQCSAIATGQDPDSECSDDGASSCQQDGACDGAGSCRLYANGTECVQNSCAGSENELLNAADMCDGSGFCTDMGQVLCAPFKCTGAPGAASCLSACTSDSDCVSGYFCDGASTCQPKKVDGDVCLANNECFSSFCTDGFCCNSVCNGLCEACSMAKSGAPNGQCAAVPSGQDPDAECVDDGTASCMKDGFCSGSRSCRLYANGTACLQNSCTGGENHILNSTDICDGAGACSDQGTVDCSPYRCAGVPGSAACLNSCTSDADCRSTHYCNGSNACVPKKLLGDTCAAANQCQSNFCTDGVCCENGCGGLCQACTAAKTGVADGNCRAVTFGSDPDNECTDDGAASCQQDGMCNGAGACRLYANGVVCQQNSCTGAENETLVNTDQCNGSGTCVDNATTSCAPYKCTGAPGSAACANTCASDTDCVSTHYCDGANTCQPKKAQGVACTAGNQCQSNFCTDGVCCDSACGGLCKACLAAKTGSPDGQCAPVLTGSDPDAECTDDGAPSCQRDGMCNGAGACRLYANGVVCQQNSCTGVENETLVNADQCNGLGTCVDNNTTSCAPYKCTGAPGSAACANTCVSDTDCVSTHYCDGANTCQPKKAQGMACAGDSQCGSNFCADGFCCDTACNGLCEACSLARNGAADGLCAPVPGGNDPDNECLDDGPASCMKNGSCSGARTCELYASGVECLQSSCMGAENEILNVPDTCSGSGVCDDMGVQSCYPYKCTGAPGSAACANSCVDDSDCVSGYYCDGANACQPKKAQGMVCTGANECQSNSCADGFCCDSACGGLCEACSLAKNGAANGLCAPVQNGTDPDNECLDDGAASCQQDGMCNGAGACRLYAAGTECLAQSCTGGTVDNAHQCDGAGLCLSQGTVQCSPYACNGPNCGAACVSDTECLPGYNCLMTACVPADTPAGPFILTAVPAIIPADGVSTTTITSTAIQRIGTGIVPDGTLITVSATSGTITTPDEDLGHPGIQVKTTAGVISFTLKSSTQIVTATVDAMSVLGNAAGQTTVDFANVKPAANAGSDFAVDERTLASLTGSGNDVNGQAVTFQWTQIAGQPISLSDNAISNPGFTAPAVIRADSSAVFRLVVRDAGGLFSDPDDVTVTIRNVVPVGEPFGTIVLTPNPASVIANGTAVSTISGPVRDKNSNPVPDGKLLTVTASTGLITTADASPGTPGVQVATSGGAISFTVRSPNVTGQSVVNAVVDEPGEASATTTVTWIPGPPALIGSVAVNPNTVNADGTSTVVLSAQNIRDAFGNTVANGTAITVQVQDSRLTVQGTPVANSGNMSVTLVAGTRRGSANVTVVGASESKSASVTLLNLPPVLTAPDTVDAEEGEVAFLTSSGSDPNGDTLSFQWTQISGSPVTLSAPSASSASFVSPMPIVGNQSLRFEVTLSDGEASVKKTVTVVVRDTKNRKPIANAGEDFAVDEGKDFQLDASLSKDDDGETLSYAWLQLSGPATVVSDPTSARPTLRAPAVNKDEEAIFQVVVNDGKEDSLPDTVKVTFRQVNIKPVANAGPPQTIEEGLAVTLDGSLSNDPDGDRLNFAWRQIAGTSVNLTGANATRATFTAPQVTADTVLRFELVVEDNSGSKSDPSTVDITVTDKPNRAPVANAGADLQVSEGDDVVLNGTQSSDPDNNPLTYRWTQTGGPTVTLNAEVPENPTFTAPRVQPGSETLQFQLIVNDGLVDSAPDTVQVTVANLPNNAPVADVVDISGQTFNEGATVTLDASRSSDADGDKLEFIWAQVSGDALGVSLSNTSVITFTAPTVTAPKSYGFRLVVNDGKTNSLPVDVTLNVANNINEPPVAVAALNKVSSVIEGDPVIREGDVVELSSAGSSDPNNDPLTYQWTQVSGPGVLLSDGSASAPVFTVPQIEDSSLFQFALVVRDDKGGQSNEAPVTLNVTAEICNPIKVVSYRMTVSAPDINPAAVVTFQADEEEIEVEITSGPARTFTIEAIDNRGRVIYRGETTVDLVGQSEVDLTIPLISGCENTALTGTGTGALTMALRVGVGNGKSLARIQSPGCSCALPEQGPHDGAPFTVAMVVMAGLWMALRRRPRRRE
ncbi:MAG: hypothetical protein GMKNLPBB_00269 [Myxococcota bacterium]|nr:hypothetical protein [Myxococcota bacterium]